MTLVAVAESHYGQPTNGGDDQGSGPAVGPQTVDLPAAFGNTAHYPPDVPDDNNSLVDSPHTDKPL